MKIKSSLMKQMATNKKSAFDSELVGNYEKHPFFIKKAAAARTLLTQVGLPKRLTSKENQAFRAFTHPYLLHPHQLPINPIKSIHWVAYHPKDHLPN